MGWFSNNVVVAANLFVNDTDKSSNGVINDFNTLTGANTVVASGLPSPSGEPEGLAFNSSGDLFAAENTSPVGTWPPTGSIHKFTPNGAGGWVQSTFASGLALPCGLAFNSSGDLFVADSYAQTIYEFTPGGTDPHSPPLAETTRRWAWHSTAAAICSRPISATATRRVGSATS